MEFFEKFIKHIGPFKNSTVSALALTQSENASTMFYPDFIAWKGNNIFFIETKGLHLIEESKKVKLTKLPKGLYLGVITQEYDRYKLVYKGSINIHEKNNTSVKKLISDFIDI
jgi:effector-binding domain-containing protein